MRINQIVESRDLCHVCGQTPCNCTHIVAEGHADQQRKVFKKNGHPVGEVGIDRESSPGVGQWYMKYYATGDDFSGYDSMEEAVADLKHLVSQFKAEGLNEFAAGDGGGGSGNYFQELASAWYNGAFDTGSLQKGIKSKEDVERLLNRGIVAPDGVTRKYAIDYNSDFDGVVISSDDYYEHSDYGDAGGEVDSRTGQPWGPYDYMEFKDEELDEGVAEGLSKQFEIIYLDQSGERKRKIVSGTSKESVARQFKKQYKLEIEQVKQLQQGVAEAAKWRDPKYKGQLYTQEPPDYNDTREYDRAMWDPKPKGYPGRKELPGGGEFPRTDPLVKGFGRYGVGEPVSKGPRKGLPSRDQITSLKQSIKDISGRHTRANLPEQGMAEGDKKPEPPEADYGADYQAMVSRVKKLAGMGPLKTVYDPEKRVYRNVPTAVQPKKEQR